MLITTTNEIQGHDIVEYKGIVCGEVVNGVNFLRDIGASLRNLIGGRSKGYEEELIITRENAIEEMKVRAERMGANAIIGVDISYSTFGADNGIMMVSVLGTAVIVKEK